MRSSKCTVPNGRSESVSDCRCQSRMGEARVSAPVVGKSNVCLVKMVLVWLSLRVSANCVNLACVGDVEPSKRGVSSLELLLEHRVPRRWYAGGCPWLHHGKSVFGVRW